MVALIIFEKKTSKYPTICYRPPFIYWDRSNNILNAGPRQADQTNVSRGLFFYLLFQTSKFAPTNADSHLTLSWSLDALVHNVAPFAHPLSRRHRSTYRVWGSITELVYWCNATDPLQVVRVVSIGGNICFCRRLNFNICLKLITFFHKHFIQ